MGTANLLRIWSAFSGLPNKRPLQKDLQLYCKIRIKKNKLMDEIWQVS